MQWEELTSDQFPGAVAQSKGVCILPLGVLERHGPHMALGTDMIVGHAIAAIAAQREPAVVFPQWFIGQIYEAKCFPGAFTLPPALTIELLLAVFDEIGRNGFTKIIAYLAHGGNYYLGNFLAQCQLDSPKPYQVYGVDFLAGQTKQEMDNWIKVLKAFDWAAYHAEEAEGSMLMACDEKLVDLKALRGKVAPPLGRMKHLKAGYNALGWYSNFPDHYAGDGRAASAAKGKVLIEASVKSLARFIRVVKQDKVAPALAQEFFERVRNVPSPKKREE